MAVNWAEIQERWIRAWEEARIFESNPDTRRPKFFVTVAYPYPNSPQHIGHGRTYTTTDIYARYKRMRGFNTLFPMGFHYTATPIVAMAKRVASGDPELIKDFVEVYRVPRSKIPELSDPMGIARYFHAEIKQGMREIGFSIDWRREFTTIDATYSRFIEWQFKQLREKGYITRGSHPVGWCPNDGNPVGQHDTEGDVEPEIGEFTLIKFQMGEAILPTATLRPETVFGVTNIWVHPKTPYVRVRVDGKETWIVSKPCEEKLRLLGHDVAAEAEISPSKLIGKFAVNPITGSKIPILPAQFVDPNNTTGVVMSVPGHAPYDYQALREIHEHPDSIAEFDIPVDVANSVKAVGIIALGEESGLPAEQFVLKAGIKSQTDPRLEDVTNELYSHEFHSGVMKPNTDNYAGLRVPEARDRMKSELVSTGKGSTFYEILNYPVICRCGTQCVVKIFENQWFIDYGNQQWKQETHTWLDKMSIIPPELRAEFDHTVDWLRVKACARKRGLGTKLPWDPEWIIESLSDSVIYMAYYTLSRLINEKQLTPENLTDDVFDYVLLGKGDVAEVASKARIAPDVLRDLRGEFTYFYPLDSRHSGRDLVQNHLTFFVFNHVAIFPPEFRPRQIVANGFVLMAGEKMSKSVANILPLRDAVAEHGADAARITMTSTAELSQDVSFSSQMADNIRERLERLLAFARQVKDADAEIDTKLFEYQDGWLRSRVNRTIARVSQALDDLQVREAVQEALFNLDNDVQWYIRRCTAKNADYKIGNPKLMEWVLRIRAQLLVPFAPFLAEEIWHFMDGKGLVSGSEWPKIEEKAIDGAMEEAEEVLRNIMNDTAEIIAVTKAKPKAVHYYTASEWKWNAYLELLSQGYPRESAGSVIRKYATAKIPGVNPDRVAKVVRSLADEVAKMSSELRKVRSSLKEINEMEILDDARSLLKSAFRADIGVYREDDAGKHDPKHRAELAKPYRPAIYVE